MSYFANDPKFDVQRSIDDMARDYAEAKVAQHELKQARRVIWLLLKQIGEPVTIDETSLLQVPDDAELLQCFEPNAAGFITLSAK